MDINTFRITSKNIDYLVVIKICNKNNQDIEENVMVVKEDSQIKKLTDTSDNMRRLYFEYKNPF